MARLIIAGDVHTHTLYSRHAYSTIEENVRSAAVQGMELLGSTDHFGNMVWPGSPCDGGFSADVRDYQYFRNYEVWPRSWHGVRVLHGCEADVVDLEGHLIGWNVTVTRDLVQRELAEPMTLQDYVLGGCDYAIASVHNGEFAKVATREQNTRMYVGALENPKVAILGHVGRSGVDFEIGPVVRAARDLHKMIEVNEATLLNRGEHAGRCRAVLEACAEEGVMVSTGTDAHISKDVGRFDKALALLEEIDFPEELLATRSAGAFVGALRAAGLELTSTERD